MLQQPNLGKTALVTGGGKGVGKAIAEGLASAGFDLILAGRDRVALEQTAQTIRKEWQAQVQIRLADLSNSDCVDEAERLLPTSEPVPEALVCNAGNYGALGPLSGVDFAAWKKSFDLNFFSAAALIQRYVQLSASHPAKARRKIVVVGGSGLGGSKVWPGISAYACAKGALNRLVETMHEELSASGIDINCIAPGAVKTGITEQAAQLGSALGPLHKASLEVLSSGGDSPEFVKQAIRLLVSPVCDGVSGRLISAKWDKEALSHPERWKEDPDFFRLRRIDNALFEKRK